MVFPTPNGAMDISHLLNFTIIMIINDLNFVYSLQYAMPSFVVYCPLHAPGCHKFIINVFYSMYMYFVNMKFNVFCIYFVVCYFLYCTISIELNQTDLVHK